MAKSVKTKVARLDKSGGVHTESPLSNFNPTNDMEWMMFSLIITTREVLEELRELRKELASGRSS